MKSKSIKLVIPSIFLSVSAIADPKAQHIQTKYTLTSSSPTNIYPNSIYQQPEKPTHQATHFFSLALQAWNPSLNPNDVERIVTEHIERQGLMKGLIEPTLALIDISYTAGRPEFGNMLNPMLKQIASPIADSLHDKYNLPLDYQGQSFKSISRLSDRDIYSTMQTMLGSAFLSNSNNQHSSIADDSNFMSQALLSNTSFFGFAARNLIPKQMHSDEAETEPKGLRQSVYSNSTPQQNGTNDEVPRKAFSVDNSNLVSTPQSSNSEEQERPKGLISKMDMVAYGDHACLARCNFEIVGGLMAGASLGPGIYGKIVMAVLAGAAGGFDCSQSSECTDPKKTFTPPKSEPIPPQPKESPKEDPPKAPATDPDGPSTPKDTDNTDGSPSKDPETVTPPAPKEPDTNDGDNNTDDDNTLLTKDGTVYVRFNEDGEILNAGLSKKKLPQVSTPIRGY